MKISKIQYSQLKKKEKQNAYLLTQFELLLSENEFLKQKCQFLENDLSEKNKIEYEEKFVHYFFSNFVVNQSNLLENEELCLQLFEEQLTNLCKHINHHVWSRKLQEDSAEYIKPLVKKNKSACMA